MSWRQRVVAGLLVALAALVAASSGLPMLVPDLARGPPRAVPLVGAGGPLSAAQSRAVLARLAAAGGPPTDIFTRHLALEEAVTGSPLTTGNAVVLLQDGPATYRAMLAAIVAARQHIHLETYILDDDEVGQRFAQALIDKRRQGVAVRLIRDSVGTLGTPAAFFERMAEAGVQVLEFNPANPLAARKDWDLNQRDHRKLLVVDGHIAFLGGINISSVYSGGSFGTGSRARQAAGDPWRDTDLQLKGPVVAELQKMFLATWAAQKGPVLEERGHFPPLQRAGTLVVRAIASTPDEDFSQIYATLLSAIGSAETSVQITNAYFVPDPQLLQALMDAAARGVDVRLILPSKTDSGLALAAGRSHYESLLRAGVKIHEMHGAVLHAKAVLVDGVWATIGSTNLDWRSFLHNHELNSVVLGMEFGRRMQAMFARDLAASEEVLLPAWLQRPWHQRLREQFARAWEYWL
ncbi:MAG: cardiolipin synthase [Rubrivivax sp.]|nr:cardiolipin synthase [Rubrivivax sp.]